MCDALEILCKNRLRGLLVGTTAVLVVALVVYWVGDMIGIMVVTPFAPLVHAPVLLRKSKRSDGAPAPPNTSSASPGRSISI